MSPTHAILTGAALIAASIVIVNVGHPAVAMGNGPFQLMHHSNATANAGVFRLDTASGEVSYCYLPGTNSADPVCSKPTR